MTLVVVKLEKAAGVPAPGVLFEVRTKPGGALVLDPASDAVVEELIYAGPHYRTGADGTAEVELTPTAELEPSGLVYELTFRPAGGSATRMVFAGFSGPGPEFATDWATDLPGALEPAGLGVERLQRIAADLDVRADLQEIIDDLTLGAGAVASVNGRAGNVTGLAEQSDLDDEAAARAQADNDHAATPHGGDVSQQDLDDHATAEAAARAAGDAARILATEKGAPNGVATLGADSKVPAAQLPSIVISDFLGTVTSQAAMLGLVGQRGDWCNRSDLSQSLILIGDDASILANWQVLLTPADAVSSVNGRTGAVTGLAEQTALTSEASTRGTADTTLAAAIASEAAARASDFDTLDTAIVGKQAHDADLDAIALLATTTYGRNLLTLANLAALQAVLGSGTPDATTVLFGNGTWATPGTSVDAVGFVDFTAVTVTTAVRPDYGMVIWRGPAQTGDPLPTNLLRGDLVQDYAAPVGGTTITGSQATASHTANAGSMRSTAAGGTQATSTSTGNAGTMRSNGIGGSQATGTHTANAGALASAGSLVGSQAASTTTGNGGLLYSTAAAGSQAASTSTANAGALVSQGITGAQATGSHTANAGALVSAPPSNVTPSLVLAETQNADATSYTTTGAVVIPANQVTLLFIDSIAVNTTAPTVTQTGVTWDLVTTVAGSATTAAVFVYRCAPGSSANATITADFAGTTKTMCGFTVITCANSNPGSNGAAGLGTPVGFIQSSGTAPSLTLAAMAAATSAAIGFLHMTTTASNPVVGTGFTSLSLVSGTLPNSRAASEWKQNATLVDFSNANGNQRLVGIEVKAL